MVGRSGLTPRRGHPQADKGRLLPSALREIHRSLVLQELYQSEPMSRADLARSIGLTRVTASDVVADLLTAGLITDLGIRETARIGKPATLLGFNDDSRVIICLELSDETTFKVTASNLVGQVIDSESLTLTKVGGDDALVAAISLTRTLIDRQSVPVLGIGIAMPGIVDESGMVYYSTRLGWTGLDLAGEFARELDLPTYVANDADMAVLAEATFGSSESGGLIAVHLTNGAGAGVFIDGELLRGRHGSAGEIGHVRATLEGPLCNCGRVGCVEAHVGAPRLRKRLAGLSPNEQATELQAAGTILGAVLAPVVQTLGILDVVIVGPQDLILGEFLDAVNSSISERTTNFDGPLARARLSDLPGTNAVLGATALVLREELGVS